MLAYSVKFDKWEKITFKISLKQFNFLSVSSWRHLKGKFSPNEDVFAVLQQLKKKLFFVKRVEREKVFFRKFDYFILIIPFRQRSFEGDRAHLKVLNIVRKWRLIYFFVLKGLGVNVIRLFVKYHLKLSIFTSVEST
jgi:hypothetical protein